MNLEAKEKDGSYVKSIVAMMNEAEPSSPPWVRESTPPRTPPSYLSVSRSNNGYNNSLLYNDQRKETKKDSSPKIPHVNGNGIENAENLGTQYVSLSQMIGPKSKVYSDLGLQLKSPEKNCRSFLRNINSFEKIGKQNSYNKSPDGQTVTMVGQKMQHLLHLDSAPPQPDSVRNINGAACANDSALSTDVPDRALADPPTLPTSKSVDQSFSDQVLKIVGHEEPSENYEAPPNDLAGQHFRKIATEQKERLLTLATLVDKQLELDSLIPDEMQGVMRCASGKANLIVRERFRQFDDLCEENLVPKPGKMTPGPLDLAGFWDMVMIEVNSIFTSFRDIAKAATMNWTMPPKEVISRPPTKTTGTRKSSAKKPIQKRTNVRRVTSSNTDENKKGIRPQR